MTQHNAIKLFEEKRVRTIWDDQQEKWYFSVVDVVSVLTDSVNPTDYLKKMRKRDPQLAEGWGQIVTPLSIQTAGGKQKVNFALLYRNGSSQIPRKIVRDLGIYTISELREARIQFRENTFRQLVKRRL